MIFWYFIIASFTIYYYCWCYNQSFWASSNSNSVGTVRPLTSSSLSQSTWSLAHERSIMWCIIAIWSSWMTKPNTWSGTIAATKLLPESRSSTVFDLRSKKDYYESYMRPPIPNLLPVSSYHILDNRNRKQLKLGLMKEKSLAKRKSIVDEAEEEEKT